MRRDPPPKRGGTPLPPSLNAWRTGSRDGPCAGPPSCAPPHGRRG